MTRYTPLWLQQGSYPAATDRRLMGAMYPVARCDGCACTPGGGMTVSVAAGFVMVPTANNTGTVLCASDAVETVTIAAAPGTGTSRIDVIVAQARGNDLDSGSNNDWLFAVVTGAASASPSVPATPNNAVAIAQVAVGAGVVNIVAANITDTRPRSMIVPQAGAIPQEHTWAVPGAIAVPSGATTYIPPMFVNVPAGAGGRTLTGVRAMIRAGTSVTFDVQRNGVGVVGLTGIVATTTPTSTMLATALALADGDSIAIVVTAVAGTPDGLSMTAKFTATP
jgi:hypothetical protein